MTEESSELICSMKYCTNTSANSNSSFYTFPSDLKMCTVWAEQCNNPEYLQDVAFLGSSSFQNRYVCSEHFGYKDVVNDTDGTSGLKPNAIPSATSSHFELDSRCAEKRRKARNALRTAIKRQMETPEQKNERRIKDSLRKRKQREEESCEQRQIRKLNDAFRAKLRRSLETEAQRSKRRYIDTIRAAKRRQSETPDKREKRLNADRERMARRRIAKKLDQYRDNIECLVKIEDNDDLAIEDASLD